MPAITMTVTEATITAVLDGAPELWMPAGRLAGHGVGAEACTMAMIPRRMTVISVGGRLSEVAIVGAAVASRYPARLHETVVYAGEPGGPYPAIGAAPSWVRMTATWLVRRLQEYQRATAV